MPGCSEARSPRGIAAAAVAALLACAASAAPGAWAAAPGCRGTVYLTLDTGNMRHAELIARLLARHGVRATFFLANEKTYRGDHALEASWAEYWRARVAEGHAFGSHTYRHGRFLGDTGDGRIRYRPQFAPDAGRTIVLDAQGVCEELDRVAAAFGQLTGAALDPWWRAAGGRTTPLALDYARRCGYRHVHWSPAGFLGDELPSDRYPNARLLAQALRTIRDGDILIAHLGIWSRAEPWAPTLDPLIAGLKQRGLCFATLRAHRDYR